jgi:GT2 family glycosyltransferase
MRILIVVVLYKKPSAESRTLITLSKSLRDLAGLQDGYHLLVWDNSPLPDQTRVLTIPHCYSHTGENLGVSGAYNAAMRIAVENECPWMLLLDQDTTVSCEYLSGMIEYCRKLMNESDVAAIAPTVLAGTRVVSPTQQLFGRVRPYPRHEIGVAPGEASAVNSGCVLRTSALRSIGGYSLDFWLDYSDIYVFHQFFRRGWKLWRAADLELQHCLSMMNYENEMTPWRCRNFSLAESAFHDCYRGTLESMVLTARLLGRAIKHRVKYSNRQFSRIALDLFLYRVRQPRAKRTARELAALAHRPTEIEQRENVRLFYD